MAQLARSRNNSNDSIVRILLLTDEMIPGGIARHVTDLANGLSERGHHIVVAATDGPMRKRLRTEVQYLSLSVLKTGTTTKHYSGILSSFRELRRCVRTDRMEIIHSHKRLSDFIGRIVARRMHVRHVSTCHGVFDTLKPVSWFGEETITSSDAVHDILTRDFGKDPSRVRTIHLGIKPLARQTPAEVKKCKELIGASGKRIIASIGRLEKSKDRLTLLRAISILRGNRLLDDVRFVIVGDGPERAVLELAIHDLDVESLVLLLDSSTNVDDIFNAAEFCILSSVREGGTLYVNLEAASLGKPHIATNVGGIPEFVVDHVTGLLVPPKSPEKLAEAIVFLINNPREVERLGHNAFLRFTEYHGYDRFIDETLSVYDKVLKA
jgi:glycosyltransferase involved in cell wall biosynthesis